MATTYTNENENGLYEERKKTFYEVDDLMNIIKSNFDVLINADKDFYGQYNIKIENEQYYVPDSDRKEPNTIYIAIKFQKATLDISQVLVPFVVLAISEQNALDVCQRLLLEYSQTFNLVDGAGFSTDENNNVLSFVYKQTYDTPNSTSHFNEVYDGYRSTFVMTGNILINYGINPLKAIYVYPEATAIDSLGNVELKIKTLSSGFSYSHILDTQPYSGANRTESEVKYATFTLVFDSYLEDNAFFNKVLLYAMAKERNLDANADLTDIGGSLLINDSFYIGFVFNNQTKLNKILYGTDNDDRKIIKKLKLKDFSFNQPLGSFPTVKTILTE